MCMYVENFEDVWKMCIYVENAKMCARVGKAGAMQMCLHKRMACDALTQEDIGSGVLHVHKTPRLL